MTSALKPIIENLRECFDGKPWYGPSVMEKLDAVSWERANEKKYAAKSIAVLVQHMINWRIFVFKKLEGDENYVIAMDSDADWKGTNIKDQKDWEALKRELVDTQTKILTILKTADDSMLSRQVPGKDYTFTTILTGIVQHDSYHLGQIAMLNAEESS